MSAVTDFDTKNNSVYVRLVGEGTEVYRPISVKRVGHGEYIILDPHVPEGEEWAFLPGDTVGISETTTFSGEKLYVVTKPPHES